MAGAGEVSLQRAHELGRKALTNGLGILDLAAVHDDALLTVLVGLLTSEEVVRIVKAASDFFLESLSPFEMTQLKRAEEELHRLKEELGQRAEEMRALNRMAAVTARLIRSREPEAQALAAAIETVGADTGGLYLTNETSREPLLVARQGVSEGFARWAAELSPEGKQPFSGPLTPEQTLVMEDLSSPPRPIPPQVLAEGHKSVAMVPLFSNSGV
ncbi:MAG: hypothetical protein ACE5LX_00365, partial [Nitrospinota bacterium]